jgi:hypothetical protein
MCMGMESMCPGSFLGCSMRVLTHLTCAAHLLQSGALSDMQRALGEASERNRGVRCSLPPPTVSRSR